MTHFATPVAGLSRAGIAINGKIFSRKSLLSNDFLEVLERYVYSRGSFSMGNYDTMQMNARAPRGESSRSRLSSKLYLFVRESRRVNTELDPRHGAAREKKASRNLQVSIQVKIEFFKNK